MKKAGKIITYIAAALIILLSIVFIVIEGRTLLSCDWQLYENTLDGFIRYFFRLLISIYALFIGIITYFVLRKKQIDEIIFLYYSFGVFSLMASSIIISVFTTNYIDKLILAVILIYAFGIMLYFRGNKVEKEEGQK